MGLRERRRHVPGGDHRRGLRDPRQVRVRGPGGREARVLVLDRRAVRRRQGPAVRRRFRLGGAGQRRVRLHRLRAEPVRDGQRADGRPERDGQEPGQETGDGGGAGEAQGRGGPGAVDAGRLGDRYMVINACKHVRGGGGRGGGWSDLGSVPNKTIGGVLFQGWPRRTEKFGTGKIEMGSGPRLVTKSLETNDQHITFNTSNYCQNISFSFESLASLD